MHDSGTPVVDAGMDAGPSLIDATVDTGTPDTGAPDAGQSVNLVERGRYLVENIGACGDCHTPRLAGGAPDLTKKLGGADCFVDLTPMDPATGCVLSTRNLTNHETGLKNRSDQEIKNMFLKGQRPDGTALHPVMPYWVLANMSAQDADAIVAFLRTVAPVDHMVAAPQAPFIVATPAPAWPDALIPQPSPGYPNQAAAQRGRYLAGSIGVCMECHSPRTEQDLPIVDRAFEGGRAFPRDQFGLPPVFPEVIYTSNLTPDQTGILGYDVAKIVKAIKQGVAKDNTGICPPMPAGPMAPFSGITDADAEDIAHYLLSLPAKVNQLPNDCMLPTGP